jgi:hypothetical protein
MSSVSSIISPLPASLPPIDAKKLEKLNSDIEQRLAHLFQKKYPVTLEELSSVLTLEEIEQKSVSCVFTKEQFQTEHEVIKDLATRELEWINKWETPFENAKNANDKTQQGKKIFLIALIVALAVFFILAFAAIAPVSVMGLGVYFGLLFGLPAGAIGVGIGAFFLKRKSVNFKSPKDFGFKENDLRLANKVIENLKYRKAAYQACLTDPNFRRMLVWYVHIYIVPNLFKSKQSSEVDPVQEQRKQKIREEIQAVTCYSLPFPEEEISSKEARYRGSIDGDGLFVFYQKSVLANLRNSVETAVLSTDIAVTVANRGVAFETAAQPLIADWLTEIA